MSRVGRKPASVVTVDVVVVVGKSNHNTILMKIRSCCCRNRFEGHEGSLRT